MKINFSIDVGAFLLALTPAEKRQYSGLIEAVETDASLIQEAVQHPEKIILERSEMAQLAQDLITSAMELFGEINENRDEPIEEGVLIVIDPGEKKLPAAAAGGVFCDKVGRA